MEIVFFQKINQIAAISTDHGLAGRRNTKLGLRENNSEGR
jgi:hypothetical protein